MINILLEGFDIDARWLYDELTTTYSQIILLRS